MCGPQDRELRNEVPVRAENVGRKYQGGVKFDAKKAQLHLLPRDVLLELAKVYEHGASKYEPGNWEKGFDASRPFDAAERHLWAWWLGEDADPDSGLSHLLHAAWNLLTLAAQEIRGTGCDDRAAVHDGDGGAHKEPAGE